MQVELGQVRLEVRIDPTATRVFADSTAIRQVLSNLTDNALRHTPGGGHVSLTASRAGTEVVFTVADDGEGIAPEHLPHLFERFYRADYARDRGRGPPNPHAVGHSAGAKDSRSGSGGGEEINLPRQAGRGRKQIALLIHIEPRSP